MSTPIFPPHKTRSASSQEKQWGSLASCVIQLRTSRARAQHLTLLYIYPPTWEQGGGCLLGEARNQDVYPRDPQHGPTASLPGAAIIHSHLHTCIHSSSGRLPALCQEFPIEPTAQQQGPETAGLSKRTIEKDTSVGRMKWELGPTGYKESARGAEVYNL